MTETVRIALGRTEDGVIHWPPRCPRCGATEPLVQIEGRVAVELQEQAYVINPVSWLMTVRMDATRIPFVVCKRHAFQNELGIRILERSPPMYVLRGLCYLALFVLAANLFQVFSGQMKFVQMVQEYKTGGIGWFALFGVLGAWLIFWARRVSSIWPVSMDKRSEVVAIRIRDAAYARDFKRANPKATHRLVTQSAPFFLRGWFWQLVLVFAFIAFIAKAVSR